jgi:hypothetical protein
VALDFLAELVIAKLWTLRSNRSDVEYRSLLSMMSEIIAKLNGMQKFFKEMNMVLGLQDEDERDFIVHPLLSLSLSAESLLFMSFDLVLFWLA